MKRSIEGEERSQITLFSDRLIPLQNYYRITGRKIDSLRGPRGATMIRAGRGGYIVVALVETMR
jgi:hypothetical protein